MYDYENNQHLVFSIIHFLSPQLSKDCELGRIPPGARQELTWRARHRWAAQRLAPFLGDLNLRPPFAPLLEVVERLTLVLHVAGADPGARGALPLSTPLLGDLPLAVREGARGAEAWAGRCTLLAASYDLSVRVRAVDERALYRRVGPREDTTADHPQPGTTRTRRTARGPGALDSPAASTSGTRTPLEILDLESGKPVDLGLAAALQHRLRGAAAEVQGAATPVHPSPARPPSRLQGTTGWQGGSRPAPSSAASTPARRSSLYAPSAAGDPGSHLHLETLAPGPYEEVERGGPGLEIEIPDGIAVFGRGDHLPEDARDLTVSERLELAGRAGWLVLVFFPFLFLGTALLVASRAIGGTTAATAAAPAKTAQGRPKRNDRTAALRPSHALTNGSDRRRGDSAQPLPSTTHHTSNNNTPINGESKREKVDPSSVSGWMRLQAWRLLLSGCRNSGVAFIKWGQWASSRQDLYPEDLCEVLAELCDQAPSHAFKETRAIVERNLGGRIEDIFESFDPAPLASGSVAQVHRAQLRMADGTLRTVAVKVRHPNVAVRIQQDFQILKPLARASKSIPSLRPFNLDESVKQFSSSMVAQADLRVEAVHLARARSEFKHTNTVSIPAPLPGYATEAVLVESFEPGESVARFIQRPSALNSKIVTIGLSTYLRMILCEGLVHTDLHPGNILARVRTNGAAAPKSLSQLLADHGEDELMKQELELVLLDFGLAVEMDAFTRLNFLSFLFSIGSGDGRRAADILLEWVEDQTCPDPEGFRRDMAALYAAHCDIRRGVDVDYVLKEILRVARRHEVAVDGSLASLIIGVVVITGFATSLDPGVNLIDAAVPAFLAYNLTGRIVERRL